MGNIINWSTVGGPDEAIVPFIRNPNSGSQEMMNEIVMQHTGILDWEVSYQDEKPIHLLPKFLFQLVLIWIAIQWHINYMNGYRRKQESV